MVKKAEKPLQGLQVLDLGHTVMGPACSMILADLGAEIIKIEPSPQGDPTRSLQGFGQGYFGYFNRNKRSLSIDLKTEVGREVVLKLVEKTDIIVENFGPGTMERLGLDYSTLNAINPRIIFVSLKGFLDGPYRDRLALDEVVQMMSGLAYMTGPSGRPLRAGTSVVDIVGGMFGVIGTLLAIKEREQTGKGQKVQSALFETAVFLMGQHICYAAQSDGPIPPMAERVSAWAIYDLFRLADESQFFVGITSDQHWIRFCAAANRPDLAMDPELKTNNQRILARGRLFPIFTQLFSELDVSSATALCEQARVPFASVARPEDLLLDPHLSATGGLMDTTLPDGTRTRLPRLPITMGNLGTEIETNPPTVGHDSTTILVELGYSHAEIEAMYKNNIISGLSAMDEKNKKGGNTNVNLRKTQ